MNLAWLDDQLLGEPLRDWLTALGIALAALLVIALLLGLLRRLEEEEIEIAFPTRTVFPEGGPSPPWPPSPAPPEHTLPGRGGN
ncbi:MAG TPA: hypothetical protein VE078_07705 [Thermoanaerobaculia bacterium]|nr:hypothetical protein [Thermoanaerobaculia bacterium]